MYILVFQIAFLVGILLIILIIFLLTKKKILEKPPGIIHDYSIYIINNNIKIQGKIKMVKLQTNQRIPFTIIAREDIEGEVSSWEPGSLSVSIEHEAIGHVEMDTDVDGHGWLVADAVGTTSLIFSGDADLGEGVTTISGLVIVEVTPAEATSLNIEFGEPEFGN